MRNLASILALFVVIPLLVGGCTPSANDTTEEPSVSDADRETVVSSEMITLQSGDEEILAYLSIPSGTPRGKIVVIQEWWGLSDWIKSVADRLASEGYVALAPDLYRGQLATEAEHAHELMRGLPEGRAVGDILVASAYLESNFSDPKLKTGVIGFCMGGRLSLLSSIESGGFDATVICYGRPEVEAQRLQELRGPVLGIFGGEDRGIGPDQIETFESDLNTAEKRNEIIVLEGAGHAFLNDTRQSFAPDAARVAWGHIDDFFEQELAGDS